MMNHYLNGSDFSLGETDLTIIACLNVEKNRDLDKLFFVRRTKYRK